MKSRIAVCPGSFDPVTVGHLDLVRRARSLFDGVVVAVGINAGKTPLLSADSRVELFREAVAGIDGVRVVPMTGLLADLCRQEGAAAIVKGLRGGADFDAEEPMALMNRHLSAVETAFVIGDPALAHVSSSMVKDVARYGGDITDLVTPAVAEAVYAALGSTPTKDEA